MHPRDRERTRKHFRNKVPRRFCRRSWTKKPPGKAFFMGFAGRFCYRTFSN